MKTNCLRFMAIALCSAMLNSSLLNARRLETQLTPTPHGNLVGIASFGPGYFLIHGDGSIPGESYLEIRDIFGNTKYAIDGLNLILKALTIDSSNIMLFHSNGNVDNLNFANDKASFSKMFHNDNYPGIVSLLSDNNILLGVGSNGLVDVRNFSGDILGTLPVITGRYNVKSTDQKNRLFQLIQISEYTQIKTMDIAQKTFIDSIEIPKRANPNGSIVKEFIIFRMRYLGNDRVALEWEDGLLSIWNIKAKVKEQEFQAHKGFISSSITVDAEHFITGGNDCMLKTWNSKGELIYLFKGHEQDEFCQIKGIALSGFHVVSATDSSIQISDVVKQSLSLRFRAVGI